MFRSDCISLKLACQYAYTWFHRACLYMVPPRMIDQNFHYQFLWRLLINSLSYLLNKFFELNISGDTAQLTTTKKTLRYYWNYFCLQTYKTRATFIKKQMCFLTKSCIIFTFFVYILSMVTTDTLSWSISNWTRDMIYNVVRTEPLL